ncbi:hypothetical protein O181_132484 [Austropuccinia psidii MF-1]|uniref:Uncharacterized protein n=1 Tax=Austropuccinia psidii MF-1 TaxID=1389203 RepID=A0A9Q3L4Y5_9BASI|nr:hypothetical protein [Austropuccinia psidii MF-1]
MKIPLRLTRWAKTQLRPPSKSSKNEDPGPLGFKSLPKTSPSTLGRSSSLWSWALSMGPGHVVEDWSHGPPGTPAYLGPWGLQHPHGPQTIGYQNHEQTPKGKK